MWNGLEEKVVLSKFDANSGTRIERDEIIASSGLLWWNGNKQ
jgi:hypothetical protein